MDLEVEAWYWDAVELIGALASGLLTPDDVSLGEYTLAQEVQTARDKARDFHARSKRR